LKNMATGEQLCLSLGDAIKVVRGE
jgi:hypothetical protein